MTDSEILELCFKALDEDYGLRVYTNKPDAFKQRIYAVRAKERKNGNFTLDLIKVHTSPTSPETEVWITGKRVEDK